MDDVSVELKAFLDYVAGKKPDDAYVYELDKAVKEAKKNRKWRHEYMTLLMRDQENQEIGEQRGEEKLSRLIERLIEDRRSQDVIRVIKDREYRKKCIRNIRLTKEISCRRFVNIAQFFCMIFVWGYAHNLLSIKESFRMIKKMPYLTKIIQ